MIVNVEIKCLPWEPDADTPDRAVVRAVVDLSARACVACRWPTSSCRRSTSVRSTRAARSRPEIATGWLTSGQDVAAAAPIAAEHGHAWLNPDRVAALRAPTADIAAAHASGRAGQRVDGRRPRRHRARSPRAGVDAIITNVPDVALAALERV